MTNSEAREYLIQHCNPHYPNGDTEWETAINLAIAALNHAEDNTDLDKEKEPVAFEEDITTDLITEIKSWINSGNRGSADYFIVDKIEETIRKFENNSFAYKKLSRNTLAAVVDLLEKVYNDVLIWNENDDWSRGIKEGLYIAIEKVSNIEKDRNGEAG